MSAALSCFNIPHLYRNSTDFYKLHKEFAIAKKFARLWDQILFSPGMVGETRFERYRHDESRHLSALADQYMDMVYRVAYHALRTPTTPDDVTQEVFLRLLRRARVRERDPCQALADPVTLNEQAAAVLALAAAYRPAGRL